MGCHLSLVYSDSERVVPVKFRCIDEINQLTKKYLKLYNYVQIGN